MSRRYCAYCGRLAHRCDCDKDDSRLHQFFARSRMNSVDYYPRWINVPYKRGVPPQIKRKERYQLKKHYTEWFDALADRYGRICSNCATSPDDTTTLVLDHIISIAKGGTSTLENLQILCQECNRIKGKLCIDCRSDTI